MKNALYPKIKCIFTDLDGTLLTSATDISSENIDAAKRAIAKGVKIIIATGRNLKSARFAADAIGATEYMVLMNGMHIYDLKNEKVIYEETMLKSVALETLQMLFEHKCYFVLYIDDDMLCDKVVAQNYMTTCGMLPSEIDFMNERQTVVANLVDTVEKSTKGVYKFLVTEQDTVKMRSIIHSLSPHSQPTMAGNIFLEILPKGVDKSNGIMYLCRLLGIDIKETMMIGDSDNDFGMLSIGGINVVMGDGFENVKTIADYVAPNCTDNGFAAALDKFI